MLGNLLSMPTFVRSSQDPAAVRRLRACLCAPDADILGEALVRAAARARDVDALVALVHERLVNLSRPELVCLAEVLDARDAIAAATLRAMAAQSERLQPGRRRLGDMLVSTWKSHGASAEDVGTSRFTGLKKEQSPQDVVVAQALKHRPLGDMVFAGCRVPPNGLHIPTDGQGTATAMRLYRSLLPFPSLLAQIPLVASQARTGHLGAALIGASLLHGGAAWRLRLVDLLDATPDPDLVSALLPHGDMLRTLTGHKMPWIDWLVALRPMWQAACEPARAALYEYVEAMGLQPALARAACVAAASCGLGGANIAVLLGELPVAERAAVIESLLQAPALRAQLHANGAFEASWQAQHELACLGAAMALPPTAAAVYRELRGAHKDTHDAQPEVMLWLTCLSSFCAEGSAATLLRLLEMGAAHLEILEMDYPHLRVRLLERLGDAACESPLVNAFADTSTRALVAVGPGRSLPQSRMAQACIKHLREALAGGQPARRAQRMFAGLSAGHAADLRQAVCEEPEALLWPLYRASSESRHVLRSGLPLVDDAVAPLSAARHVYESLNAAGLPALAVANATHLALVMQEGAVGMWSSSLKRLDDDALICAVTGLLVETRPEAVRPGHNG